ncbi:MAG: hypothetical protein ACO1NS_06290 [Daejeonella sp.]|uniref:hypothetical protein n=1 Tax=Daejeonella sp. JGW-45 TaxID=3034148 RepID=UPI0023ECD4C6|nr:hypothetical protein [Daejeonella sp. JGW-45]
MQSKENNETENSIKTVAFIANVYRNRSHADVIGTKLFLGIPTDEGMISPQVKIVSMWIDQIDATDTGVRLSEMHGAAVYPTIAEALTLGGDKLAVDAVIYIGEHGTYKKSRLGATMYPRMNYLEQIFRVFDASKKVVPLFSDKHLSYSWLDSKWIYDRAKELNVPMMAGSTLPYAWRDPVFQHPLGTKIKEAVAIGYASLDSYGIHAIEILQCMVERRKGGETGVRSVHTLAGNDVWAAIDSGKISKELVNAGVNLIKNKPAGSMRDLVKMPYAVLIHYIDGTKGSILMLQGYMDEHWAYAANAEGKMVATEFVLDRSKNISRYYPLNIQKFIVTGKPTAPIERNLLTSGIMDTVLRSLNDGEPKQTPFLGIKYTAEGYEPILPGNPRPTGASIGPWPPKGYEFLER